MADDRPLYVLHIEAERVSSEYSPTMGFQALVAVPLATSDDPERKPLEIPVRLTKAECDELAAEPANLAGNLDAYCATAADRKVRDILAGDALPSSAQSIQPRHAHKARAVALATRIIHDASALEAELGPDWLAVLLEKNARAVYADGEAKGYRIGVQERQRYAETGEWFETELRPRLRGDVPKPGDELGAKIFNVAAVEEE